MYFRNEFGQSIYGSDSERDGVVTLNIGSNLYSSDFVLDYIQLYDDNDHSNHVTYNSNGTYREQTWNLEKIHGTILHLFMIFRLRFKN